MTFSVDEQLRDLIPPLSEEERDSLAASLLAEGCREAIIVWDEENVVVDGHNRLELCEEHGITYKVDRVSFADRAEAMEWMCLNQLGRRNLSDLARADLRGRVYNLERKPHGGDRRSSAQSEHLKTSEKHAALTGVSGATIRRDGDFSAALNDLSDLGISRQEFTSGKRKVSRNHVIELAEVSRSSPAKAKKAWKKVEDQGPTSGAIKSALREVDGEAASKRMKRNKGDLVEIHHGDFVELTKKLKDESIDAIVTDPPYPQEYLHTWSSLSEVAMRILKPGGWCIAYSGKQHLDDVMRRMGEGGLAFFWQIMFLQTVSPAVHPRKVNTKYKPILVFQKPPLTPPDSYFVDVIKGERVEKGLHEWQQSENGFAELIEIFTNPGDRIVEPFAGGGTCPAVAQQLNRYCIAYEIEQNAYAQSCERVFGGSR